MLHYAPSMRRRRLIKLFFLLLAMGALMYALVSFFLPSSRRLVVGVNKRTGRVRVVANTITFLPPFQFYRLSFEKRGADAQRDGIIRIASKEEVPLRIFYRIRFSLAGSRLPDSRRLVADGWTAWLNARVAEAVKVVTAQVPIEDFASPTSDFTTRRARLRDIVIQHLGRSGLDVTAFEIERIEIDRKALLQYKRLELRRNARGAVGRVALFSLDGADWELLSELSDDGRIPNIRALIQGGTTATVQTIQPTVSPLLATTVATGLPPDRHGVVSFFDRVDQTRPVTSQSRRAPALWEIAPAFGRSTEVVGWWTAWPPSPSGALVVHRPLYAESTATFPPQFTSQVASSMVSESSIEFDQIRNFLNITSSEFQKALSTNSNSDPVLIFRATLAKTWSDQRAALAAYRQLRPQLMMVSFNGTDTVNHLFGPFHPPLRDGVNDDDYRKYWPAVASYYSEIDRFIGEWMKELPSDTTVMLFSSHGMRWGKDRPKAAPAGNAALSAHRNSGIFIAYGNRILPSRASHPMSVYDFAPAILALLGLPASKEMPGTFPGWAFRDLTPVSGVNVISYGDFIEYKPVGLARSLDLQAYRSHLQLIGHLVDPTQASMPMLEEDKDPVRSASVTPVQWGLYAWYNNQGVNLKVQKKTKEAIESFEKAIELNPTRPTPYLNLAMLLFAKEQYTEAEEVFLKAVSRGLPDAERYFIDFAALLRQKNLTTRAINLLTKGKEIFPQSYLISANLGSALAAGELYTEAVPELERALGISPASTFVLNNLGSIYLRKRDHGRALDYWNRSLAVEPGQPMIRAAVDAVRSRL